ncbi:Protein CBG13067 [Caenorhabditis briggsae]|uniref:Protein CBG13067 n=1 Tax=Caenorhabditis briggsae TaxID=6238 RepID=A8XH02_CAEBR|nr:Protein CBG13067 [Caenorhabditis briggsae]CAP31926.2 Protein CBG13067 [Caenorhabditis briggsae]
MSVCYLAQALPTSPLGQEPRFGMSETAQSSSSSVTIEPPDSIFSQGETLDSSQAPWWQRTILTKDKVLFGTWDGVFATVMVNIFGIIVFLRLGWIVGTAGVANSILLLGICTSLALITVFSAIGIVERCQIKSGGIYFLVSHVLGHQLGGAVGIIYAFGQAVATGLVAVGFGESVAHLFESESKVLIKAIAILTLMVLTAVNTAGVTWVVRLQIVLLLTIALAVTDFIFGALLTSQPESGVFRFSSARIRVNAESHYEAVNCSAVGIPRQIPEQSFFTVFGVFFANFLGVLAGVNMSGDLKDPHKSIPLGELSAVGVSSTICFVFIMVLGGVGDRMSLLCDVMISEKVALTGIVFLVGLYVCSLSSTVGSLLGTPRVLQGIAEEGIIPCLNVLARGVGPNDNPVLAGYLLMGVASLFVLLGDLNQLAILSTMPFLITYAYVNYSYVSLAMSYDLATVQHASEVETVGYGSTTKMNDLNELFPERRDVNITSTEETETGIITQEATWYSMFSNRYVSFLGFLVNLAILLLIHFWFAVAHFVALIALYWYIGRVCPTCGPGISNFSLCHMFKTVFLSIDALRSTATTILPQTAFTSDVSTSQQNETNPDYQDRRHYHHSENVTHQLD